MARKSKQEENRIDFMDYLDKQVKFKKSIGKIRTSEIYESLYNKLHNWLNGKKQPLREHEDICIFYKKQPTYNPQMVKCLPHYRNHSRGKQDKEQTNRCYGDFGKAKDIISDEKYPRSIVRIKRPHPQIHATEKPVALIEWLVKTYTNEGEIVLDNTAGSMTTAIACINTSRRCICMEKDGDFFEIGRKRVEEHQKRLKLF